jgi:uncharacterized membrane protein
MNFDPILSAPLAIKIHLLTVVPAFVIGTWLIFFSTKGAPFHRSLGYLYLGLMTITAIATIFIHQTNPSGFFGLSFIHLFIPLTLFGVMSALIGVRTGNIHMHRGSMIAVYVGSMLIAGGLAFLPGRIMHVVFFG